MAKFKATAKGFFADRLRQEGDTVEVSDEFLAKYKAKTKKDFEASWLEPIEEKKKPGPKPKQDAN